jgi:hypothetical protein
MFSEPNMGPTLRTQQRAINQAEDARKKAKKDVQKGIDQGSVPLTEATQVFDPLIEQKTGAFDTYYDSLGLNGPEGRARALQAFQEGPGYQYNLEQMQQGADRFWAGRGGWNSGNALDDLTRLQFGLANNEFGGWQNRLQGEDPTNLFQSKGTALTNLGKFFGDMYTNKAQVGIQGGQLANSAYQSLANGQMTNANNQAAADNALPAMLIQGGLNGLGGYFQGGYGA